MVHGLADVAFIHYAKGETDPWPIRGKHRFPPLFNLSRAWFQAHRHSVPVAGLKAEFDLPA
jgi:hypothetical protein